jgi:hypothetical protein
MVDRPCDRQPCSTADVDQAVEESAGSQDHGSRSKAHAELGHHPGDRSPSTHQIVTGLREDRQLRLILQATTDRLPVEHAIGLRARRAHRRALARIENPELDARLIGGLGHRPAQGVDFLDQMPFADAADRRIAAHRTQRFEVVRQQQRPGIPCAPQPAPPRCRHGRHRRQSPRNGQERAWAVGIPRTGVAWKRAEFYASSLKNNRFQQQARNSCQRLRESSPRSNIAPAMA